MHFMVWGLPQPNVAQPGGRTSKVDMLVKFFTRKKAFYIIVRDPLCIYINRQLKDSGLPLYVGEGVKMITTFPIWSTQVKHTSVSFSALVCDPEMEL